MNPPKLTVDGAELELVDDDPLSDSSVKAKIAYDHRDNEYVLVWWQVQFDRLGDGGAYSMTASIVDEIPGNIDTLWAIDKKNNCVKSFERAMYDDPEERIEVPPDHPIFNSVVPSLQYAVETKKAMESYHISDVELP